MPSASKNEKQAKRRAVAKGALAGKPLAAIAKAAGCSKRHVQRLEREPETQFLIVEALRPHRAVLTKMAGKALRVIERAFMARKTDGADRIVQLRAVERYHEMMDLAQGTAKPPDQEDRGQVTWEEFVVMYRARKETHESNPPDSSPLG
jgi:hypothetical protein